MWVPSCTTPPGVAATCEAHAFSLLIDVRGNVFSETLHPGKQLVGQLDGNRFLLTTTLANGGTIAYDGALRTNRRGGQGAGQRGVACGRRGSFRRVHGGQEGQGGRGAALLFLAVPFL
ncbi:MAG: hypothetical protein M9910_08730 [Kiritimatiellae bacterium]|nr:hypothetical protein [Kiritimatiellia bacterium]